MLRTWLSTVRSEMNRRLPISLLVALRPAGPRRFASAPARLAPPPAGTAAGPRPRARLRPARRGQVRGRVAAELGRPAPCSAEPGGPEAASVSCRATKGARNGMRLVPASARAAAAAPDQLRGPRGWRSARRGSRCVLRTGEPVTEFAGHPQRAGQRGPARPETAGQSARARLSSMMPWRPRSPVLGPPGASADADLTVSVGPR